MDPNLLIPPQDPSNSPVSDPAMTDPAAVDFDPAEAILNSKALHAELTALSQMHTGDALRQSIVSALQTALSTGRETIAAALADAPLTGRQASRAYSTLTERIVCCAMDAAVDWLVPGQTDTRRDQIALLAVGGFGRGEMAPFSDVDLLFLTSQRAPSWLAEVIEATLYILWDLKLKVGQSVRSIPDCLSLGREDITIRTSLLERRHLWGSSELVNDLDAQLRDALFQNTGPEFVEAKLAERETRHSRNGGSRYLVEPNVKEGKGGLRDLQTLYWIGKYLYDVDTPEALVDQGVFNAEELEIFTSAENFLWSVRCHLHSAANRANEHLTFDMQVEVARAMGFEDMEGQIAVERFMQVYFLHARAVGELSRIFLVALEAQHIKQRPSITSSIMGIFGFGRDTTPEGFQLKDGRLTVEDQQQFLSDPVNILRLFAEGVDTDILLHPDALRMAAGNLTLIDDVMCNDPEANTIFMQLLTGTQNPERGLRRMNETGVLGAFIPEFGRIVAMMQFNMYHHYTVDEHTINCISILSRIEREELLDGLPIASSILKAGVNRRVLYTAMLLHDIGKGRPEPHEEIGAEIAAWLCPRLGLDESESEQVVWLVRHHLLMSDVAQKRDIADPRTVTDFARIVKSPERLKLLLVLTVSDIMGVGPGTWNNWKAVLLRQLYGATRDVLTGGHDAPSAPQREAEAKAELVSRLVDWSAEDRDRELARHYRPYWLGLGPESHVTVATLARNVTADSMEMEFSEDPTRDATKATFVMGDHPGIFARLAGAIALAGANVVEARTFTTSDGLSLSIFWLQDHEGHPYDASRRDRLQRAVRRTLRGEVLARQELAPKDKLKRREKDFVVPTAITFDNTGSELFTIIEVDTRDRPGLLHDLTRALAASNINIFSAIIATYGEQAVDAFYVKDLFGMKLHSEGKRKAVEAALREAVMRRPEGTK